VWKCLHRDRKFVGPHAPVRDYRFAAGLLFERFNDHSWRILTAYPNDWPTIQVGWYRDFAGCIGSAKVQIEEAVLMCLLDEGLVEGIREFGSTNNWKLRLSNHGKRMVVGQWFVGDGVLTDLFTAGAAINAKSGEVRWS
jgi:hypothetical protein